MKTQKEDSYEEALQASTEKFLISLTVQQLQFLMRKMPVGYSLHPEIKRRGKKPKNYKYPAKSVTNLSTNIKCDDLDGQKIEIPSTNTLPMCEPQSQSLEKKELKELRLKEVDKLRKASQLPQQKDFSIDKIQEECQRIMSALTMNEDARDYLSSIRRGSLMNKTKIEHKIKTNQYTTLQEFDQDIQNVKNQKNQIMMKRWQEFLKIYQNLKNNAFKSISPEEFHQVDTEMLCMEQSQNKSSLKTNSNSKKSKSESQNKWEVKVLQNASSKYNQNKEEKSNEGNLSEEVKLDSDFLSFEKKIQTKYSKQEEKKIQERKIEQTSLTIQSVKVKKSSKNVNPSEFINKTFCKKGGKKKLQIVQVSGRKFSQDNETKVIRKKTGKSQQMSELESFGFINTSYRFNDEPAKPTFSLKQMRLLGQHLKRLPLIEKEDFLFKFKVQNDQLSNMREIDKITLNKMEREMRRMLHLRGKLYSTDSQKESIQEESSFSLSDSD